MTTPADELRTAAKKLWALAGQATPAPWVTTWRGQDYQLDGNTDADLSPVSEWTYAIATCEPQATEQRAECDTANADYIAAMHPGVGTALANWLEETAEEYEAAVMAARHVWGDEGNQKAQAWLSTGHGRVGKHALAVARQINAQS